MIAEIGGVDVSDLVLEMEVRLPGNEQGTATLTMDPEVADSLPPRFSEVIIYANDGETPILGGLLFHRSLAGLGRPGAPPSVITFDVKDWRVYAEWTHITLSYDTDPALEDVLGDIAAALSSRGVTYTPSETGITIAAFSVVRAKASDVLRDLSERTGLFFVFSPSKAITIVTPGEESAPVAITDEDTNCEEIAWEDSDRTPANAVILVAGEGTRETTEDFALLEPPYDGGVAYYQTAYPAVQSSEIVWPNVLIVNGAVVGPMGYGDDGSPWYWDAPNHRVVHVQSRGGYMPTDGDVLSVPYTIQYPFEVRRPDPPPDPAIEELVERTDVQTIEHAIEVADGILERLGQEDPRIVSIETQEDGFAPGQSLTINVTSFRGTVVGTFVVSAVTASILRGNVWTYSLTVERAYQGSIVDRWRELIGVGSASRGTAVAVVGAPSVTALASPAFLGGLREASVPMAGTPAWTPVLNYLPFYASSSFSARVRVDLKARASSVGVTARLYNVTDAASVGESDEVEATTWNEETFTVAIEAGKAYRLEVISDTGSADVFAIGQLEAL